MTCRITSRFLYYNLLSVLAALLLTASLNSEVAAFTQRKKTTVTAAASPSTKSTTIRTEPDAIVWLDEVRRGVTDASGRLTLANVPAGRHVLRVRASGFKERTLPLLPTQRGEVVVKLVRTTDEAELLFQQAEAAREKARDDEARQAAADTYRRAIKLRPSFAAAHLGLARVLLDLNNFNAALDEIEAARRARPVYPEASAVEGRILRETGDTNGAMAAFRRAIREARGFQPEAHTGLARVLEDKGQYEEAAAEYRIAVAQLSDTEPVLYQLLGAVYEKLDKYKEAVAAYEKYLQLAPEGTYAEAVRSIIDQLRSQAAQEETPPSQ